jgi:hypothetical protein
MPKLRKILPMLTKKSGSRSLAVAAAIGALAAASVVVPALAAPAFASDSSTAISLFTDINIDRTGDSVPALKADGYLVDDAQALAKRYADGHGCPTADGDAPEDSHNQPAEANFVTCVSVSAGSSAASRLTDAYFAQADHGDLVNNPLANYVGVGVYTKGSHIYSVLSLQVYNNAPTQKLRFGTPKISGTAKVGHTLVVQFPTAVLDDGLSSAAGVDYYVWWYEGTTIVASGANEYYNVQPSDIGKKISVQVEASKTNYTSETTGSTQTSKVVPGTFKVTTTGKFDQLLGGITPDASATVTPNVTPTYVWHRGSTILTHSGAGVQWYSPVVADLSKNLYVNVTYQATGYTTLVVKYSKNPFKGLQYQYSGGTLPSPTINGYSGSPTVGETLSADNPEWVGDTSTDLDTWKVNGVTKGTGVSIVVKSSWVGKKITVTYTAKGAVYEKTSRTSSATPKVES